MIRTPIRFLLLWAAFASSIVSQDTAQVEDDASSNEAEGTPSIIPERDNDTFGLGYYHANLSDDLPGILGAHSEQDIELYYNIEVTPWLHISPDL